MAISGEGDAARYNGSRNIFFFGTWEEGKGYNEMDVRECACSASDLRVKFMDRS